MCITHSLTYTIPLERRGDGNSDTKSTMRKGLAAHKNL